MLYVLCVHRSGSSLRRLDLQLHSSHRNLNERVSSHLQFNILGFYDCLSFYICFHQCKTLKKTASLDYNATSCHNNRRIFGRSSRYEMVRCIFCLCAVRNLIFSHVWTLFCSACWIRSLGHMRIRIKLPHVWSIGVRNDIDGSRLLNELVYSLNALLFRVLLRGFVDVDLSKNH